MILLSPQELQKLTQTQATGGIRETTERELDAKMREILEDGGMNQYEKIKKYDALLQRYLRLIRQGENEMKQLTVTVAQPEERGEERMEEEDKEEGERQAGGVEGMLQNLPVRDRKNAEYVLRKLSETRDGWTTKGEFVYRGKIVKGSHMIDLVKTLTASYKKSDFSPPRGWNEFLSTLSELNIPESSVSNPRAREQLRKVKNGWSVAEGSEQQVLPTPPGWSEKKKRKKKKKKAVQSGWGWMGFVPH